MSTKNPYCLKLETYATARNKAGAEKFITTKYEILGVQMPPIRLLAKEIKNDSHWRQLLTTLSDDTYEELVLQSLVIATAKMEPAERLNYVTAYLPKIDNWGLCDSFVSALKFTKKNQALVWDFLQSYLNSDKEFFIRFGVVMLLDYFMTPEYVPQALKIFNQINHPGYYVKMAVAWAVAEAYIKQPTLTLPFIKKNKLDSWTHNKAIQKIIESYRVSQENKNFLRTLKRPINPVDRPRR